MYEVHVFTVSCSVAETGRSERTDCGLFPGLKKTIERSPFFVRRGGHYCRGDLVGWTTVWFFFWVACKS